MKNKDLDLFEDKLDIFYLAFGQLRQSIWKVEPRMRRIMLSSCK